MLKLDPIEKITIGKHLGTKLKSPQPQESDAHVMVSIREIDLCRLTGPPPNYVLNDHNVLQGIGVVDQGVIYLRHCHKRACLVWNSRQFLV